MKLPGQIIIPIEKITKYLLVWRPVKDKSKYYNLSGYTLENWQELYRDIYEATISNEAIYIGKKYLLYDEYHIHCRLPGRNGRIIGVNLVYFYDGNDSKLITAEPLSKGR